MTILESYKTQEALDLKERGLLFAFTTPMSKHDSALLTWKKHLKDVGAPYLVVQNGRGCVILKERKDFRCHKCGGFLNARPPRNRTIFTHRQLGLPCPARR